MHELYKELWLENYYNPQIPQIKPPSSTTYKRVFCQEYNLSFYKPKKDQCSLCAKYNEANENEKENLKLIYEIHKEREKSANLDKSIDKEKASTNSNFVTVTYDLQSVLQIPSSDVSPMYYSRKLCCYNFTVYEGALPNKAYCYVWTEVHGKRGSNETGSCLYRYINTLDTNVTGLSLFTDTCGGQNRNKNVAAILMFIVQTSNHIKVIEQKFLESGHSMMECDSMHSSIEKAKKYTSVYTVNDWLNIFKYARSSRHRSNAQPYEVIELEYNEFYDLAALSNAYLQNTGINTSGEKVNWLKIKTLRYDKDYPNHLLYRYDYTDEFCKINIKLVKRSTARTEFISKEADQLKKAYTSMLPISKAKYNDLQKLCKKNVIPSQYHAWYASLPCTTRVLDLNITLESDSDETSE